MFLFMRKKHEFSCLKYELHLKQQRKSKSSLLTDLWPKANFECDIRLFQRIWIYVFQFFIASYANDIATDSMIHLFFFALKKADV